MAKRPKKAATKRGAETKREGSTAKPAPKPKAKAKRRPKTAKAAPAPDRHQVTPILAAHQFLSKLADDPAAERAQIFTWRLMTAAEINAHAADVPPMWGVLVGTPKPTQE